MEYIVHHRYRGKSASGEQVNIPYGSRFQTIGDFIATDDGKGICYVTSEDAQRCFSINDDGKGLERGKYTHAIAYGNRRTPTGYRFTEDEAELLAKHWSHFLRQDVETILFNREFFEADPAELKRMAAELHIKVK